jgi:hypothetical protein
MALPLACFIISVTLTTMFNANGLLQTFTEYSGDYHEPFLVFLYIIALFIASLSQYHAMLYQNTVL